MSGTCLGCTRTGGSISFNWPTLDRFRWLEPRHQVNIQGRWNRDKNDDLQFGFFNGEGWESWENVWGIWNCVTPRDGRSDPAHGDDRARRSAILFEQRVGASYAMHMYGVFASCWPLEGRTVCTTATAMSDDGGGGGGR